MFYEHIQACAENMNMCDTDHRPPNKHLDRETVRVQHVFLRMY